MRKFFIVCTFLLTFCGLNFAQNEYQDSDSNETAQSEKKEKIDEFGALGECEFRARLDYLLFKLQNKKDSTGYLIFYQGKDVLPADYETNLNMRQVRNHISFRNQDPGRLVLVDGGFREKVFTELWLVPNGASPPLPTDTIPAPKIPTDKTFLYDKNNLWGGEEGNLLDEYILPDVKAKEEAEQLAYEQENQSEETIDETTTEIETAKVDEEVEEPEIEQPTAEEREAAKFYWTNEKFGELIKNQKDSHGVIIFYADDAYYDVGKLQSHFEEGKRRIAEAAKISASKIRVVFGGYRSGVEAEFWIVPKKGKSPKPTPEERLIEEKILSERSTNRQ